MMSNEPITEQDLQKANPKLVKMIGKIETVRVQTEQVDGARQTRYYVSGVDWGYIFNNVLYIDNLIAGANDPQLQGNAAAIAIRNALFGQGGTPKSFNIDDNLRSIIGIFGQTLDGFTDSGKDINRLAKSIYNFIIPREMVEFFNFKGPDGKLDKKSTSLNELLTLRTGILVDEDRYERSNEAIGYLDPFSFQGQHTFWQMLIENSNPVLNELFNEMRWNDDGSLSMLVYNRIKPFAFKDFKPNAGSNGYLKSYFQNIKRHEIDSVTVMSINAGTNWRDKYNFIEIKPEFQDFNIIANWSKQKSQVADPVSFQREGFRPLILETKQFPSRGSKPGGGDSISVDFDQLLVWAKLMREWYFNTHRMLNGTIVMQGVTDYIAVGDNIRFDAALINPTPNINKFTVDKQKNQMVLAHVESISHSFTINGDVRTYTTTIQFVRGIVVNGDNVVAGSGILDKLSSDVTDSNDRNTRNTVSTSTESDPHEKVRGR